MIINNVWRISDQSMANVNSSNISILPLLMPKAYQGLVFWTLEGDWEEERRKHGTIGYF
jgi:hypothetical protein